MGARRARRGEEANQAAALAHGWQASYLRQLLAPRSQDSSTAPPGARAGYGCEAAEQSRRRVLGEVFCVHPVRDRAHGVCEWRCTVSSHGPGRVQVNWGLQPGSPSDKPVAGL
jgi:hypothetical protein